MGDHKTYTFYPVVTSALKNYPISKRKTTFIRQRVYRPPRTPGASPNHLKFFPFPPLFEERESLHYVQYLNILLSVLKSGVKQLETRASINNKIQTVKSNSNIYINYSKMKPTGGDLFNLLVIIQYHNYFLKMIML